MGFRIINGVLEKYIKKQGETDVVIPEGVTSIEKNVFKGCSSLTSVTIPNSVKEIEAGAFEGCSSLTSVTIPNSVKEIGNQAFFDCSSMTSVTIPEGVTSIGWFAFAGCSSLTSVTIPSSVKKIGWSAFEGCKSLTSVTIPNSVKKIEDSAFEGCSSLTSVIIPGSVKEIGEWAFCDCSSLTSVTIPDGAKEIGDDAFKGCSSLTSVIIPGSVKKIGEWAFCDCSSLTSVTIPDGVKEIGVRAFCGCSSLTSAKIPNSVKEIEAGAFEGCSSLTSVTIPNSVKEIEAGAFEGCSSLTSVTIPDGVKEIGVRAFYGCSSLTSVTIPKGVMSIGVIAFSDCKSLTSVTIPDGVKEIEYRAFYGCSSLTSVTIQEGVTSIKSQAFYGCSSLTSVTIPGSVKKIGEAVFWNCKKLTNVTIPDGLANIFENAFLGCNHIKSSISKDILTKITNESALQEAVQLLPLPELIMAMPKCPKWLVPYAEEQIIKSKDILAVQYFEKHNRLDEYASFHKTDADTLRDSILSDFGLDKNGCKTWNLAGKKYMARMENNLKFTLLDENGKELKSFPKKDAKPEEYDLAKKELAQLKKDISAAAKLRNKRLLADFLEARPRNAKEWKKAYLKNPLLKQLAKLIVWQQEKNTFTLNESGKPIDSKGKLVSLTDASILLAHPMTMGKKKTKEWQEYFQSHHLSQPFAQVWEPVLTGSTIRANRYKGVTIPLYMLMNKKLHGISMEGQSKLKLRDCTADLKLVKGHKDWINNEFEITNFQFKKFTRSVNHIAAHFDKGTMLSRLLKDDVSAVKGLDYFTLAQITEFIKLTTEKGDCPNAVAALLDYKQSHYPETDPFDEFVLDL